MNAKIENTKQTKAEARKARLKNQLRANLHRRKDQSRQRDDIEPAHKQPKQQD